MSDESRGRSPKSLFKPRYWGIWLGIGLLRLLIRLPFRAQTAIGNALGRIAWPLAREARRVGDINLRLCFPQMSPSEREQLLRRHLRALGCGLLDTAMTWWGERERILKLTRVEGMEHLQKVLGRKRGALLVSAHFTAAEMGVRALSVRMAAAAMYQRPRNALVAHQFANCPAAAGVHLVASDNVRELLRALKDNLPVWFAADQREHMRSSTLAPFFGIPVVSNTAPARIARITAAPVLPYSIERDDRGYLVRIGEPLDNFPSEDEVADATRLHKLVEEQIGRTPEQYLWTYKRFKRPGPDGDPYQQ